MHSSYGRSITSSTSTTELGYPTLTDHITNITESPLPDAVTALSELVPDLISYISYTGLRVVSHPKHTGSFDLNQLSKTWMRQGCECCTDNAPFATRLEQYGLLREFQRLYKEADRSVGSWSPLRFVMAVRGFRLACPHCMGDPSYCIPEGERVDDALGVRRRVFEEHWPERKVNYYHKRWGRDGSQYEFQWVKVKDLEEAVTKEQEVKRME